MATSSWVDRLADNLDRFAGEAVRKQVMAGSEETAATTSAAKRARWIKGAMERLDALLNEEARRQVLEHCACGPASRIQKAKAIYKKARNLDEFVEGLKQQHVIYEKSYRDGESSTCSIRDATARR